MSVICVCARVFACTKVMRELLMYMGVLININGIVYMCVGVREVGLYWH